MKDTATRFSHITISLHWLIALTFMAMIPFGFYMANLADATPPDYTYIPLHKSIGATIFVFVLIRVVWRLMNGWPVPLAGHKGWEITLAKLSHWILLLGTIAMPASGIFMSVAAGRGLAVFGVQVIAMNDTPNKAMAGLGHEVHEIVAFVLAATITIHLLAALKHHVIDKDGTLRRMLGQSAG